MKDHHIEHPDITQLNNYGHIDISIETDNADDYLIDTIIDRYRDSKWDE